MPRELCELCDYPCSTCLCAHVRPVNNQVYIHILQHPKEVKLAKNTARLLNLCMSKVAIHVGEESSDFVRLRENLVGFEAGRTCVVYPSEESKPIDEALRDAKEPHIEQLIFIDATWRKAYKMWQSNSWLRSFPSVNLNSDTLALESHYKIRKTKKRQVYSTLESVVATLNVLEPSCQTEPLMALFEIMQDQFTLSVNKEAAKRIDN
ncbi:MAG: DTW domain-containing protein YfiP [Saprospiraceae bacterium]|jgi:DTW domain-containing protein YfiP